MTDEIKSTTEQAPSAPLESYTERKEVFTVVQGRFNVYPKLPLSLLDMPSAQAFQAEDTTEPLHKVFALVCRPDLPVRKEHIKSRVGVKLDGVLPLVDAGAAFWPPFHRKTMILIYSMPLGGRVVQSSSYGKLMPDEEAEKISKWVRPLLAGISDLAVRGLTHREIRPDNLFYMDVERTKIVWGDCISCPAGYDQPPAFETIETAMCQRDGKGEGATSDDLYAFGVTLICLGIGYNPVENMSSEELLDLKIHKGSYATLIGEERVPLALIELFRGLLADNIKQRWDISSTTLWADGRRLTPVQAKASKTSQRPFTFNNVEFFNRRALSYAFARNWDLAADSIRSERFLSWVERGLDDKETAEAIRKSVDDSLVKFSTKEKQDDYFIARTCMLLDPDAPLRVRGLSFMPGAVGTLLARNFGDTKKVKILIGLIATGFMESWYEIHRNMEGEQSVKEMQSMVQKASLGMGIEHLLYDLNKGWPCQSPLIVNEYVEDIKDLLPALENVAKKASQKTDPVDRHIAAFISVRGGKKVAEHIAEINSPKEYVSVQGVLNLFAVLQKTFGPEHLNAMTGWIGGMTAPVIESYHNAEKRQQLEKNLPKVIRKGSFPELCAFLNDRQERLYDLNYFERAKKEYLKLAEEIDFLSGNRQKREEEGMMLGNQVAAIISFGISVLTMFVLLATRLFKG